MPQVFKVDKVKIEGLHWLIIEVCWYTQRCQVLARELNLANRFVIMSEELIISVHSESAEHLRVIYEESLVDLGVIGEELEV